MGDGGFAVTFQTGGEEVGWWRTCINITQHGGMIASPAGLIYRIDKHAQKILLMSSFPPGNPEFDYNQLEETRKRHVEICRQLGYIVVDVRPPDDIQPVSQ